MSSGKTGKRLFASVSQHCREPDGTRRIRCLPYAAKPCHSAAGVSYESLTRPQFQIGTPLPGSTLVLSTAMDGIAESQRNGT